MCNNVVFVHAAAQNTGPVLRLLKTGYLHVLKKLANAAPRRVKKVQHATRTGRVEESLFLLRPIHCERAAMGKAIECARRSYLRLFCFVFCCRWRLDALFRLARSGCYITPSRRAATAAVQHVAHVNQLDGAPTYQRACVRARVRSYPKIYSCIYRCS